MKSPDLMKEVVNRLHLNMNYVTDGRFHKETLYGDNLPVTVAMIDLPTRPLNLMLTLWVVVVPLCQILVRNGESLDVKHRIKCKLNQMIHSPLGKLAVMPSFISGRNANWMSIHVSCTLMQDAVSKVFQWSVSVTS